MNGVVLHNKKIIFHKCENVTTQSVNFVVTFFYTIGNKNVTTQSVIFVVTFFYPIRNENVTTRSVIFVVTKM